MNEIRKYFNVEEITIGHGGDSSVGLPCEYTYIQLSDEMAEILQDNGTTEHFKNELFELFKKYNDEVQECTDDVDEYSDSIYEMIPDMSKNEMKERIEELEEEKKTSNLFSKIHKMELFILKSEVEDE